MGWAPCSITLKGLRSFRDHHVSRVSPRFLTSVIARSEGGLHVLGTPFLGPAVPPLCSRGEVQPSAYLCADRDGSRGRWLEEKTPHRVVLAGVSR